MKSILIYIFHLIVLSWIAGIFIISAVVNHHTGAFKVIEQMKPLALVDNITCATLFLFAIESNRRSIKKILLICIICWILTSIVSTIVAYLVIWYSNIPEMVIRYQQMGIDLAIGNLVASFIASAVTAWILILRTKKIKKA